MVEDNYLNNITLPRHYCGLEFTETPFVKFGKDALVEFILSNYSPAGRYSPVPIGKYYRPSISPSMSSCQFPRLGPSSSYFPCSSRRHC